MKGLLGMVLWLGSSSPAWAQAGTATIRLADVIREAAARNPEIAAAREGWLSARAGASEMGWPMDPRLSFERMFVPEGSGLSGAMEKNIAVSQEFPFPTALYYSRKVGRSEAASAFQMYRAKRLEVAARARAAFAMYFLADRELALLDENVELMRGFARSADGRYAAGKSGQGDPLRASVELTRMLNMRIAAQQERAAAAAMLNAVLDRDPAADPGTPEEPALEALRGELEQAVAAALRGRPELLEADSRRDKARGGVALARSRALPDVMLQYRRRESKDPAMDDTWDAMLGFTVPLWFGRQAASLRRARAERDLAEAESRSMRTMTAAETRSAFARARAALALAESYKTSLLPQARQSLEVAQAAYRSDKGSFMDLLDSQRSLLTSKKEYYEALAETQLRAGELQRLTGDEEGL